MIVSNKTMATNIFVLVIWLLYFNFLLYSKDTRVCSESELVLVWFCTLKSRTRDVRNGSVDFHLCFSPDYTVLCLFEIAF